ncbi:hypothetical protein [Chitinophaga sancti]|uniref:Uncharacterized protein n=1 Tax=Chitinophaga sancti TaxID=1004 RepID=A0A1K1Q4I9_9BACT|nr:hypothetical protein [Chitinophaga sancti]WQD61128.1 hypothetical protein U0033_24920 [Chitinophaga sancti]WQG86745.1 hypothetical protein SR876_17545 [Chitinophaga sancti]SFW54938.1 hypothetical protein SAMN05661012_02433 [Chitinophaga sancti]
MKKQSTKKLNLAKVKIASLQGTKQDKAVTVSFAVCTNNASQVLSICSIDSCRY